MLFERFCSRSGLTDRQLERFAINASKYYKTYHIKKKNGGLREISHPTPELKALQRWITRELFDFYPSHTSATAYTKNTNIRENAELHKNTCFTLRMDFKEFFPSFKRCHIAQFLQTNTKSTTQYLSDRDISFICNIVLRHDALTIGAPSSPRITNVLLYSFDRAVSKWAKQRDIIYTRYADDMFLSTNKAGILREAEKYIHQKTRFFKGADLRVNEEKTAYLSKRYRRIVTGLIVTPQGRISLGRLRKREMRSMIFQFQRGLLSHAELVRLGGLIGFSKDAEPEFFESLEKKYSQRTIEAIVKGNEI